ncbi:endonuclease III domain-containing protein [Oxyplasma meridianum]|uniref:Endonuclease III domain-containing protein n=1 Tax=Oxyplasma meridianum TaxID=3073602 RepID=A0AAX4NIT1_9ARCH
MQDNWKIRSVYSLLLNRYGFLNWWPAETKDEVVIGTILTQNTSWSNVEKCIKNLKKKNICSLSAISSLDPKELAPIIRSSGFYNQKSKRLVDISHIITERYSTMEKMSEQPVDELELFLKNIKGVGRETMDSILSYALQKPVFVVDKYTMRIFSRTGITGDSTPIDAIKGLVYENLGNDGDMLRNLHAMLVYLGKDHCKTKPLCAECPVKSVCNYFITAGP